MEDFEGEEVCVFFWIFFFLIFLIFFFLGSRPGEIWVRAVSLKERLL